MKNQYFKTTTGLAAQVFITKASAYSTAPTFGAFVQTAVEGEIGVFITYKNGTSTSYDPSVAPINPSDTALTAKDKFFIAQKRNGTIHSTSIMTYGTITAKKSDYIAPVKQETVVGFDGTSGSLNIGTLVGGQIITLGIKETTPGNMPYPTWNYEETVKVNDTEIAVASRLIKQINSNSFGQNVDGRIVNAILVTNGSYAASSGGAAAVTAGSTTFTIAESAGAAADAGKYSSDASTMTAGQYLRIGGSTGGVYKIQSITGAGTALATVTLDSPYLGTTGSVAAADLLVNTVAPTEVGIRLISIDFGRHFRIFLSEDSIDADVNYIVPYKEGAGTYNQVKQLEDEGYIRNGYAYDNIAFKEDFGAKIYYSDPSKTYDLFFLNELATQNSKAVLGAVDTMNQLIIIASPAGEAPTTDLDGMFV